jgi:hypothetical protein
MEVEHAAGHRPVLLPARDVRRTAIAATSVGMTSTAAHDPIASTAVKECPNVTLVTTTADTHHTTVPTARAIAQRLARPRRGLAVGRVS